MPRVPRVAAPFSGSCAAGTGQGAWRRIWPHGHGSGPCWPHSAGSPHSCGKDCARIPRGHRIARASSGGAAERHAVARHRIAAGDEARRAEEPAVATPKMICALEGRHSQIQRNIVHANDFAHCSAPPGRGRIYRLPPRGRALRRSPGAILCLAPRGASSHLRCLPGRGFGRSAMATAYAGRIPRGRRIARASPCSVLRAQLEGNCTSAARRKLHERSSKEIARVQLEGKATNLRLHRRHRTRSLAADKAALTIATAYAGHIS